VNFRDLEYRVQCRETGHAISILNPIDGQLKGGQLVFLTGGSGAGKSTLLKILCQRPVDHAGEVLGKVSYKIGDRTFRRTDCPPAEVFRQIAYVAQRDVLEDLSCSMTVREILTLYSHLYHPFQSGSERYGNIAKVVKTMSIESCVDVDLKQISGGQMRRVSIGIRLLSDPLAMFFDEPTSGLDAASSLATVAVLHALAKHGVLVVLTIHQPRHEILRMAHQTIILAPGGRLVFRGDFTKLQRQVAHMKTSVALEVADKPSGVATVRDVADQPSGQIPRSCTPIGLHDYSDQVDRGTSLIDIPMQPQPSPARAVKDKDLGELAGNPLDEMLDLLKHNPDLADDLQRKERQASQADNLLAELDGTDEVHDFPQRPWFDAATLKSTFVTVPTVFTAIFFNIVGGKYSALRRCAMMAANLGTPIALTAVSAIVVSFCPGVLPLQAIRDMNALVGVTLVIMGTSMTMFQVDYTFNVVVGESNLAELLIIDGVASRFGIFFFWTIRTFLIVLVSCPGFLLYHYGLGFAADTAGTALVFFIVHCLGFTTLAMFCSVVAGQELAPALYGAYAALNLLASGILIPQALTPGYWSWLTNVLPMKFAINAIWKLEFEGMVPVLEECEAYNPEFTCPTGTTVLDQFGYTSSLATSLAALLMAYGLWFVVFLFAYTGGYSAVATRLRSLVKKCTRCRSSDCGNRCAKIEALPTHHTTPNNSTTV
jgi:ABC-type multidrug transport system ATPase subunit